MVIDTHAVKCGYTEMKKIKQSFLTIFIKFIFRRSLVNLRSGRLKTEMTDEAAEYTSSLEFDKLF